MGSYADSADNIVLDRFGLAGGIVSGVFWGIHATFVWLCVNNVLKTSSYKSARSQVLIALIFVLFAMGTLNFISDWAQTQQDNVDNRLYPGGPSAYSADHYGSAVSKMGNIAYVLANFFADSTMLYRTFIVWNQNYLLILAPFLLFLASTTLSIFALWATAQPNANFWTTTSFNFLLAYFSVSISLNVLLTILIAGRLLWMSGQIKRSLGRQYAQTYTSIAAMIVECALPYSATGFAFIICYAVNHPLQEPLLSALSQLVCISPELIILRVATGRAWAGNTAAISQNIMKASNNRSDATEMGALKFKTEGSMTMMGTLDDAKQSVAASLGKV